MVVEVSANGKKLVDTGVFHYEHYDNQNDEGLKITYNGLNMFIRIVNSPDTGSSSDRITANVNDNNVTFLYECKSYESTFRTPNGFIKPIEVAMNNGQKIYISWTAIAYKQGPGRALFAITFSIYEDE
ncbi:hypothetical protein ACAK56_002943 [Salmonella enterica]